MTTTSTQLPHELLSLVHHIELHRSGWWDKALGQLILHVLWLNGGFMTAKEISSSIADAFSISVDIGRLYTQLEELEENGNIVNSASSSYKITEERTSSLRADIQATEDLERRVRRLFIEKVSAVCPELDPDECWNEFKQSCLIPLVMEMGAKTYGFMSGGKRPKQLTFEDTEFFAAYEPDEREALRHIVVEFITPDEPMVRDYVLRTLDAAFFLEASGLQKEALENLSSSTGGQKSLTLFLDTNLLFSVLNLHVNPSNQSVNALLQLIGEIDRTVTCALYALPITIDEFRRTVRANCDDLKHITLPANVATAALASGKLSGLKMRYMEACQESGKHVDPEDFFRPYASNSIVVMRDNGVELYNDNLEGYSTRQDVVDDINEIWRSEDTSNRTDARYRAITHDMTVRHFVNDRRPAYVDSPLEGNSWFVTIDYRLLRYDRESNAISPVCIHPTVMIQMLQFWVPRSETLETAMIEGLRIPFAFRRFDGTSEKVALRILEVLSRFEVGDLSTEVITQVLVDDAMQAALGKTTDRDTENAILKEGLLSVDAELKVKLEKAEEEAAKFRSLTEQQSRQIGNLQKDVRNSSATLDELQSELSATGRSLSDRDQEVSDLQTKFSKYETESAARQQWLNYLIKWVLLPAIVVALVLSAAGLLASSLGIASPVLAMASVTVVGLAVVSGIAEWRGSKVEAVKRMIWFLRVRRWRRWVYGTLGTILLGLVSRFIWQFLQPLP